jgi:bifunctional DNA-binding transcriptional regulator/antitoxin component of YhaV-PrlF toxin-antitoxin module
MSLVKVKDKYQVTLPAALRAKAGVSIGDVLEAKCQGNKITLTPKSVVDREIAISLKEIDEGKTYGPFNSAKDLVRSLNRESRKLKKKSA